MNWCFYCKSPCILFQKGLFIRGIYPVLSWEGHNRITSYIFSVNPDQGISVSKAVNQQRRILKSWIISQSPLMCSAHFTLAFHQLREKQIFNGALWYEGWTGCPRVWMAQQMRSNFFCTTTAESACRKDATQPGLAQSDVSRYIYFLSQGWQNTSRDLPTLLCKAAFIKRNVSDRVNLPQEDSWRAVR